MNIFISVLYEEYKPETYKGVEVHSSDGSKSLVYNSGEFNKDLSDATMKALEWKSTYNDSEIMLMSSVDHYYMDTTE